MSDNEQLVHCVYSSAATIPFEGKDVIQLLEVCRKNNEQHNVTGMLLFDKNCFFQVLEGMPDAVDSVYQKIKADERHDNMTKIIYEPIEERNFADWSMGYSGARPKDLEAVKGLNDFFSVGKCYIDLDEGRAKILLQAFKEGRWRASIG